MKFGFCKKQYVYLGLAIVSIGLAVTSHVSAQEPTGVTGAESQEQGEVAKEEDTEGEKAVLPESVQNRIINLARNMISRLEAAAERSEQINKRTESRIRKLSEQGVETDTAEMVLKYAKAELTEAQAVLPSLDANMVAAVSSDSPREAYKNVKKQFRIASASVRDSYVHLKTIVGLLKNVETSSPAFEATEEEAVDESEE